MWCEILTTCAKQTCLIALSLAAVNPGFALGDSTTPRTSLYGESTSNIPQARQWSGSAWSAAAATVDVGANPRWQVLRNCPTRNELLAVCSNGSNQLNAFTYNGTAWSAALALSTNLATSTERPFYAAYEQSSGDALVAYRVENAATLYYRTWNGTSWSAESNVATSGAGYPSFIKLVPKPGADEIMAIVLDTSSNISALIWNGSSFGNLQLLESTSAYATEECVDAAYEQATKRCNIVWGKSGTTTPQYKIWNGTSWLSAGTLPTIPAGIVEQVKLAADSASDKIIAVLGTSLSDIEATVWSGAAWGSSTALTTIISNNDCRSYDVAFEPSGTSALCVFGQNYYPNWVYRKQITIDYTKVSGGASLTDFPVLIDLASDADLAATAQSSGNDIFFTSSDGTTTLSHEIEKYTSGTGALVAWVKVPTLSASANTVLYMYYGNPNAANQQNATGVWTNSYNGVWHLNGTAADSTSNANNGTISGATSITGRFASALNYNGTTDYVSVPNAASLQLTTQLSLEGWVRANSFGSGSDVDPVIRKGETTPNNYQLCVMDRRGFFGLDCYDGGTYDPWGATTLAASTWYYLVGTWTGSTQSLYINGTLDASYTHGSPIGTDTRALYIGGRTGSTDVCDGRVDEVRLSSVARTAGWITTEYNNLDSPGTFYTLGAQTSMGNMYYRTYNGSTWSSTQTGPATTSVPNVIQLVPSSSGSEIFVGASRTDASLMFMRWDGTSLVDSQTLSSSLAGSVQNESFMFSDCSRLRIINWREIPRTPASGG